MQNHLIICGMGHVGYQIAELLHSLGEPFAVITRDLRPEWENLIRERALLFVEGDARSEAVLQEAGIASARALLIVTQDDMINIEIALDAPRLNPSIAIVVRVFDLFLAERIRRAPCVRNVLGPALLTAPVFVAAALGEEVVRVFDVAGCQLHILNLPFNESATGTGESIHDFCARFNLIPVCLRAASEKNFGVPFALDEQRLLSSGDILTVAVNGQSEKKVRAMHAPMTQASPAAPTRKGGLKSFFYRSDRLLYPEGSPLSALIRDIYHRSPRVIRFLALVMFVLVVVSVGLFHAAMPHHPSWIDAFYFVITITTTVGFGDFNLRDSPWWLKLYGCGMMIASATLVATIFGAITDYIVTLRVEQNLGRRPTTLTNHVVVIGLGNVGSRVVESLYRMGVPVLAIERTPEQEALPEIQDKIPVLVADANRASTLQQANIAQARAVIITSSSDVESLRLAHHIEQLNPKLHPVLRIYNSALARKIGDNIGLGKMVNPAKESAPSFVASALHASVEQGFLLQGKLLMLRWILPEEVAQLIRGSATVQQMRDAGYAVLLRRVGEKTVPLFPEETVTSEESLLVLEGA